VLLSGINHIAVLTGDTGRFLEFYGAVFDAGTPSRRYHAPRE